MHPRINKITLFICAPLLWFAVPVQVGAQHDEGHVKVVMRMIGHELLLRSGDSTSRVLPVERVDGRYRLRFASAWGFDPDELVALADSVIRRNGITGRYRVEVEACAGREVVYSYEVTDTGHAENAPCRHRLQPVGCYEILFTILHSGTAYLPMQIQAGAPDHDSGTAEPGNKKHIGYATVVLPVAALLGLAGVFVYSRRKKTKPVIHIPTPNSVPGQVPDPDVLSIGAYRFDKKNMTLSLNQELIELTGKESDLLILLYSSVNTTVPRDVILNTVWGDEGDYIGRTLDVFISRLRKKLDADPGLKIMNIRGVGYKLIVNN